MVRSKELELEEKAKNLLDGSSNPDEVASEIAEKISEGSDSIKLKKSSVLESDFHLDLSHEIKKWMEELDGEVFRNSLPNLVHTVEKDMRA